MKGVHKTDAKMILKGWKVRPLEEEHSVSGEEEGGGQLNRSASM